MRISCPAASTNPRPGTCRGATLIKRHKPSFIYSVSNRQALALLESVTPWLKFYKRERARLILRDYVRLTPRNGKYSPEQKAERQRFESDVLALKANP